MNISTVNLEYKMPTVENARIRLDQALRNANSQNIKLLKLIHGYGSTGKGGAIKRDVAVYLNEQKSKGRIVNYVTGEDFSPFSPACRELLSVFPSIAKDNDYSRANAGITLVWVKK